MAHQKKSFLLYCDIINTIEKLPDDLAGKLFKHILNYVNDNNPELDDLLLEIAFEPIKQSLKRDLKKYKKIQETARINGSRGGRPKNQEKPNKSGITQPVNLKPKKAVSVSVSDSVSVSEDQKNIRENSPEVSTRNNVPFKKIVELYHEMLPELPKVEKLTKKREGYIRQRWIEDLTAMQNWENYFDYVKRSPFLMGQCESRDNRPPFRASLEWLTNPSNFAKVSENKYHGV